MPGPSLTSEPLAGVVLLRAPVICAELLLLATPAATEMVRAASPNSTYPAFSDSPACDFTYTVAATNA